MPQVVSLEIESIAAGGDGVGRTNGLVVFVPRTAPGDLVTVRIAGKGSFARGSLRSVPRPSADRTDPPCPHYTGDRCGGCQIQHLAYPAQLRAKQRIIRDAVERIGKRQIAEPEVRPSPLEWRYRTKLTLALRRTSTGQWIAGLHQYDDPSRIFALADCPITDQRVVEVWHRILANSSFLPTSQALRGSVRITADGPVFTLIGAMRFSRSDDLFDALPDLAAIWWENDEGGRRLLHDRRSSRRNLAVVDIPKPKLHVKGFLAWMMWMGLHLVLLLGVKNRFAVFSNWIYNYVTYDQNLRLIFKEFYRPQKTE